MTIAVKNYLTTAICMTNNGVNLTINSRRLLSLQNDKIYCLMRCGDIFILKQSILIKSLPLCRQIT